MNDIRRPASSWLGDHPNFPEALCRDADPKRNPWFPEGASSSNDRKFQVIHAKETCALCPHVDACRQWAVDHPDEVGIWGGTTEADRRKIRRGIEPRPLQLLSPIAHGSESGYAAEKRRGLKPCDACREAANRAAMRRRTSQAS